MAQPQSYNRDTDFTERDGDDTNHAGLNQEFDAAALSINQLRDNLKQIQRDDGALKNGIVTADALAPSAFNAVLVEVNEAVQDAQASATSALTSATTANTARDQAVAARQATETARDSAISNANAASASAQAAANSQSAAAASQAAAAASQTASASSQSAAAASATSASNSAATATTQAGIATTQASNSAASATASASSAAGSQASRVAAESARDDAQTARTQAQNSQTAAASSASAAAASQSAASSSASSAGTSATAAATSATQSANSATASASSAAASQTSRLASEAARDAAAASQTAAASSQAAAANSATAAATSASQAATSATNSANSATSSATSLDSFRKQYQGASDTAPTTRYDGSALQVGDLYFNSTTSSMQVRTASGWTNAGSSVNGTSRRFRYIATQNQTTFTGVDSNAATLAYDAGFLDVYLNGVRLDQTDFTATSGTSLVLAAGAAAGDELHIVAFGTFSVATAVAKSGDTMSGPLTVPDLTYTGGLTGGWGAINIGPGHLFKDLNGFFGFGSNQPAARIDVFDNTDGDQIRIRQTSRGGIWGLSCSGVSSENFAIYDRARTQTRFLVGIEGLWTNPANTNTCLPHAGARAWVNFNGSGTVSVKRSMNVSSVTRLRTGVYRLSFANAMPYSEYTFAGYACDVSGVTYPSLVSRWQADAKSTTSLDITTSLINGGASQNPYDAPDIGVSVFC